MTVKDLSDVLEGTGYTKNGQPADGVLLGPDAQAECRARDFSPEGSWRSDSALTVYFKSCSEVPSEAQVARWRQGIWNEGFAPLLWVVSPQRIDIYNGFGKPQDAGDAATHRLATFRTIQSELNELEAFAGRLAMETGQFWQDSRAAPVDRRTSVDGQLLSDLAALERKLLTGGLGRSAAQGLIGRSIFTQYLIDRNILSESFLDHNYGYTSLSSILRDPPALGRLLNWLRVTFNGDMFLSDDSDKPNAAHLSRVADFLDGTDLESGQMSFFPYQFDVIPVELISLIYEQFAQEFPSTSRTEGERDVYYTRMSLVSLVMEEIAAELTGQETILDPTCGSGIFLVEALRRLVHLRSGDEQIRRDVIRSTLYRQIYGVDISESAVRVAAFSLYLAALELEPDLGNLSDSELSDALTFQPLVGRTLIAGDARTVEESPAGRAAFMENGEPKKFDVIIGNPPWSYRGRAGQAERPRARRRRTAQAPRAQSLDFLADATRFASDETKFGFVLSAVQFFSRSATGASAVREIIEELSPITLINLANHTDWLFRGSRMPAMVFLARHRQTARDLITTVQIPWSEDGKRHQTFEVSASDIVTLPLAAWRKRPQHLKAACLGTRRDIGLLDRLTVEHGTLRENLRSYETRLRAGLIVGDRSRDSSFLHGLPLLTKADGAPFAIRRELDRYADERAQWPRTRGIYRAPLLIVKEFLPDSGRPLALVANRDVIYTDAFHAAALPAQERRTARLLAGVLSSSLASWFFLMNASTFGLSMRRLLIKDIEALPVPDSERARHSKAGDRIVRLVEMSERRNVDVGMWNALDEAVFDLYGIGEGGRIVARDGLFRARWQWKEGRRASVKAVQIGEISEYARTLMAAVEVWLTATNRKRVRAEIIDLRTEAPLRIVRVVLEERGRAGNERSLSVVRPEGELRTVLDELGVRLSVRLTPTVTGKRELRVYGDGEVVIIKPAARRHWMSVSALEDADAIIAESLSTLS